MKSPTTRQAFIVIASAVLAAFCTRPARADDGSDRQAAIPTPAQVNSSNDEIVNMEAYKVTTTIGTYHEDSSSMATKIPTDTKEIASSLQVLNAAAIADRNALSLPDVFAYVVGATQSQQAANGFSFRGFPNTGTFTQNIEFDGLQGATLKKGASSAANVESLEFLKGPNGVLYGQMHPGGLLNIVTKSPEETPQYSLRATYGTYLGIYSSPDDANLATVTLDATGPIDSGKHLLYRLVVDTGSDPASRPGDFDQYISIYPSLEYRWGKDTSFTIKAESSQDVRHQDDGLVPIFNGPAILANVGGVPTLTAAYGETASWYVAPYNTVYEDTKDRARDRGASISEFFKTRIGDWVIRGEYRSVWHTDYTHEFTVNNASSYTPKATYATPTSALTRQYNLQINGHRYNYADANAYDTFGSKNLQDTVLIGVGGGSEFSNNSRFAFGPNVSPAVTLINPNIDQSPYPADGTAIQSQRNILSAFGEYITDQIVIMNRLHISAGVRNDNNIAHGTDVFNPAKTPYVHQDIKSTTGQAGIVFDITGEVACYASWSQSVVPNTVTSVDATGQSNFPPETGLQYETGVKFERPDHNLYMAFDAYYIDRSNVLVSTGTTFPVTGQAIFRLDGAQHSEGMEFESEWQPYPFWQLQGGIAAGKAFVAASVKNPQTVGLDLVNAPRVSGNFWNRFNVPSGPLKGLGAGLGVIYVGNQWAGDPTTTLYYILPSWYRVDLAAYYQWKRYSFSLNIQNLLDRQYILSSQSAITLNPGEARKLTFAVTTHY